MRGVSGVREGVLGFQLAVGHSEGAEWSEGGCAGGSSWQLGIVRGVSGVREGGLGLCSWQLGIVRGVSRVREGVPGVPAGSWA